MTDNSPSRLTPALGLVAAVAGLALVWARWSGREPALRQRTRERLG